MSQAFLVPSPIDEYGPPLGQAQAVIVEAAQHTNATDALSVAQHLSEIDNMARLSKMVLAGRHVMSQLHTLFRRFEHLEQIEIALESEAVNIVLDYVEYGLELSVRSCKFSAPPESQPKEFLAVHLDLVTQGISPELMRAALGVEGDGSHKQVLSVSRSMFGDDQEPDLLAALYGMLPELPQLLRQSQGMLDFEAVSQPVQMRHRG